MTFKDNSRRAGVASTGLAARTPKKSQLAKHHEPYHRSEGSSFLRQMGNYSTYRYTPLDLENDEIRLISIMAGQRPDEIQGMMIHTTLKEAPKYESLSYCWEDHDAVTTSYLQGQMKIDGRTFRLGSNLEAAIRRLRPTTGELIIWIDAICIDQHNIKERNEQVTKMRLIYQGADIVRAWLGESRDDSEVAFQILRDVETHLTVSAEGVLSYKDVSECNPLWTLSQVQAVGRLFERGYWGRVWVVQELFSAMEITIHCGATSAPWPTFFHFQRIVEIDARTEQRIYKDLIPYHRTLLPYGGPYALQQSMGTLQLRNVSTHLLFDLLCYHQQAESTDKRDKVYALVGISDAGQDARFILDYAKSIKEVYVSAARYIIESSLSINVICWDHVSGDFPSWLPNLGSSRLRGPWDGVGASGSRSAQARISTDEKTLTCGGFCIGNIQEVENDFDAMSQTVVWGNHNNLGLVAFWIFHDMFMKRGGEMAIESQAAFARCLCHERPSSLRLANGDICDTVLGAFISLSVFKTDLNPVIRAFGTRFKARNGEFWESRAREFVSDSFALGCDFFITKDGKIGTAHRTMVGDLVCILFGCDFPIVLRERAGGEGGYVLVGDAYVDEWSDGEAIAALEEGLYQEEEFAIW